jgi:ribosomal protein S27AE
MEIHQGSAPGYMYQGQCRRVNKHSDSCPECDSVLYRKGDIIYCCKCTYTRLARREEDKKVVSREDWNGI